MELTRAEILERDGHVRVQAGLGSARGVETIWYELEATYGRFLSPDKLDGFVVAALLIAMERGEPELVVRGAMSERLFHNLQRQLIPIWRLVNPGLCAVSIHPEALTADAEPNDGGVVTGFSAGVDSFCTLADYLAPASLPDYRLTHLLFCNVGNHGDGEGGRRIFGERWRLVKDYGPTVGLSVVRIDSNLNEMIKASFTQTHVARNSSAVLLLQGLFAKYLFSSSYGFQDCYFGETTDVTHADPAAVHLLSTEGLECISTGCQYSRVEKTRKAITAQGARQMLNVCNHPLAGGRNCSKCYKCLRTLSTLDLLGELDQFAHLFELAVYRRRRFEYLTMLPVRIADPFIREIYEFSRTPEARLPRGVALLHAVSPVYSVVYRSLKALKTRGAGAREKPS